MTLGPGGDCVMCSSSAEVIPFLASPSFVVPPPLPIWRSTSYVWRWMIIDCTRCTPQEWSRPVSFSPKPASCSMLRIWYRFFFPFFDDLPFLNSLMKAPIFETTSATKAVSPWFPFCLGPWNSCVHVRPWPMKWRVQAMGPLRRFSRSVWLFFPRELLASLDPVTTMAPLLAPCWVRSQQWQHLEVQNTGNIPPVLHYLGVIWYCESV